MDFDNPIANIVNAIIVIVIIYSIVISIRNNIKERIERKEYCKLVAQYYMEKHSWELNLDGPKVLEFIEKSYSYYKANPEKFMVAENEYKNHLKADYAEKEAKKRELIKKRVFAYDYEEMLYEIYAPTATRINSNEWKSNSLNKDYIIERIGNIMEISKEEALKIFDLLIDKKILEKEYRNEDEISLCYMLNSKYYRSSDEWQIVSDIDLNLSKWMVNHGY